MTTATATKTTTLPKGCIELDSLPLEVASVLARQVAHELNPHHGRLSIQVVSPNSTKMNPLATAQAPYGFHVIDEYVDFKGNISTQSVVMSLSLKALPVLVHDKTDRTRTGWEVWMKVPKGWKKMATVF